MGQDGGGGVSPAQLHPACPGGASERGGSAANRRGGQAQGRQLWPAGEGSRHGEAGGGDVASKEDRRARMLASATTGSLARGGGHSASTLAVGEVSRLPRSFLSLWALRARPYGSFKELACPCCDPQRRTPGQSLWKEVNVKADRTSKSSPITFLFVSLPMRSYMTPLNPKPVSTPGQHS